MFLAACEGFFDNWNDHSALVRLQTLFIVQASGAKLLGGGTIRITDLWSLRGEKKQESKTFVWPEDTGEFKKRMEAAHNIKIG